MAKQAAHLLDDLLRRVALHDKELSDELRRGLDRGGWVRRERVVEAVHHEPPHILDRSIVYSFTHRMDNPVDYYGSVYEPRYPGREAHPQLIVYMQIMVAGEAEMTRLIHWLRSRQGMPPL